jgi:molybdate transport system substrate-binding protein
MKELGAAWGAVFAVLLAQGAAAAEISVLSGGAIEPGLRAAASAFEKQTGDTVKITFNTTPQIRKRIDAGEKGRCGAGGNGCGGAPRCPDS